MDMITCYMCNKEIINNLLSLSCGHHLCKVCLSHTLILNEFKSITNEEVTFKCYCEKGSFSADLKTITDLFPFNKDSKKCSKHQLLSVNYCLDCKIWICLECKKAFHDDYFSFHRLTDSEPKKVSKCLRHHIKIEKYCNICNRELCSTCSIEDNSHSNSHIEISSFLSSFKEDMLSKLNYKSYEEIEKIINGKEILYRNEIMNYFNQTKTKIEEIINASKLLHDSLNNQIEKDCIYSISLFHLMKYSYYNLFHCLNSFSIPVSLAKELNKIKRDIDDINIIPEETKEIDMIVNTLLKIKPNALMKFSFKYSANKEKEKDKKTEKAIEIINSGHLDFMSSLCYINNQTLATGSVDHSIRLFQISGNPNCSIEYVNTLNEHRGAVRVICLLKDGKIATGSNDKTIKLWELSTSSCLGTLIGHSKCVRTIIQINNNHIASGGDDMNIMIWDLSSLSCIHTITGHKQTIFKLYNLKDNKLCSCSDDKTIKIWSNNKWICLKTLAEHTKGVTSICQLEDEQIVSGSKDKTIKIWNSYSYICNKSIIAHSNWVNVIRELKSNIIATGGRDNVIKIWNFQSYQCLKTITGHTNTILDIIVLNNDKLISGSCDKTLMIINSN